MNVTLYADVKEASIRIGAGVSVPIDANGELYLCPRYAFLFAS